MMKTLGFEASNEIMNMLNNCFLFVLNPIKELYPDTQVQCVGVSPYARFQEQVSTQMIFLSSIIVN